MDIFNLCQKKNYIILNFNYLMVNTFLVIFLNQKVRSILNPIHKVFLSILLTTFWTKKKKKSTKEVKGIKINLDFIFNNFLVHRTGLRLVYIYNHRKFIVKPLANQLKHPGFYDMFFFFFSSKCCRQDR